MLTEQYNAMSGSALAMFEDKLSEREYQDLLEHGWKASSNALELAIQCEAKTFLATPVMQEIIDMIYDGKITYLPPARVSVIEDSFKLFSAERYDARSRPLLDHYRLRVPRIRVALESINLYACRLVPLYSG